LFSKIILNSGKPILGFLLLTIAESVLITWIYNNTKENRQKVEVALVDIYLRTPCTLTSPLLSLADTRHHKIFLLSVSDIDCPILDG